MNNNNIEDDDEIVIDLGVLICDIWKGFKKYWWLLPVLCVLVAGAACGYKAKRYYPMYRAQASFTVSTTDSYVESNTTYSFYYETATAEQMTKLFPYILSSEALQELIKEDLEVAALPGSLSASGVDNSNLITLTAVSNDPEMARRLIESAMEHFPEVSRYVIGETRFNVIESATTPEAPMNKPNYPRIIMKGAALGALVFCGLLLLYALLRMTIRKEEDIHDKLHLHCAGVIPRAKFKAHRKAVNNLLDISNPRVEEYFSEAIERLAYKVEKRLDKNEWKVLVVTSTLPREGKSSISWNMAAMMAKSGKKILLVDADLRNPSICYWTGQETDQVGLVELLKGKAGTDQVIQKHDSGVWVIAGSKNSSNPHGVLSSDIFRKFIGAQKNNFDYIIIDTPPCGMISDAGAVAQYSDAVLYVIRQDMAKQGQILDGIQKITGNEVPVLGAVLNVADVSFAGYGYRYSGYNKYGKYYRYGKYGSYGKYGEKESK